MGTTNMHVLVVDEDEPIRELLRVALSTKNLDVDEAGDGDEALRRVQQRCYDAVVLDLMIQGSVREDVLSAVIEQLPQARRVVLTTCESPRILDDSDAAVVRVTLRKPFDLDQLVSEVVACATATASEQFLAGGI